MMLFSSVDDFVERYNEIRLILYGGPPSPDYVDILSVGSQVKRGRNYEHPGHWAMSNLWFMQDVIRLVHARTEDERNFIAWGLHRLENLSWHMAAQRNTCPYSRSFLYAKGKQIVRRVDEHLSDVMTEQFLFKYRDYDDIT
jgi:hypothetical protein